MFGKRFELFKLFGFSVKVDLSWLIIAVLVTWSLAAGIFPTWYPRLPSQTYWVMGLAGMLGLFLSIVLHELSHSLVARQFGMSMRGITLFIFGGVAEMEDEPPSAKAEFMMAVAGPLASVVISVACYAIAFVGSGGGWPTAVNGVFNWLGWINAVLVVFNIVPAFPLDGGRVFRSLLWQLKGNLRWATRITSRIGAGFGILLIVAGAFVFMRGDWINGMWFFLIGLFLRGAAQMSYQQLLVRSALEGEPVRRFMNPRPVTVDGGVTVDELVQNYVYKHHFKMFPVVENGRLQGCVTTRDVRSVPQEYWPHTVVRDILQKCSDKNTIDAHADAMKALSQMNSSDMSRVMVVDHGELVGVLSLKDMMKFLALKVELEGDERQEAAKRGTGGEAPSGGLQTGNDRSIASGEHAGGMNESQREPVETG